MERIILVGSGGCMREIAWQIFELNSISPVWNILGYIDKACPKYGKGIAVGKIEIPYLGTDENLLGCVEDVNVAICIGDGRLRKHISEKLMANPHIHFPNIILGETTICKDIDIGCGCIICVGTRISTNVKIGKFVLINMDSMVCHDGEIGNYTTLSPDVKIAGNVCIGEDCTIGIGARIKQGIIIKKNSFVGAGAVVVKNVEEGTMVVGVPAKPQIRR